MTVCPIAMVASCKKCPAVSVCPLKTVLGDYVPEDSAQKPDSGDSEDSNQPKG